MFGAAQFHSRLTTNPLAQPLEETVNYCSLRQKKTLPHQEKRSQILAQANLRINKQTEVAQAEVLKFVYDWDDDKEEEDKIGKKSKGIADFLEEDSDKENQELPCEQASVDNGPATKALGKALADFLSDDEEKKKPEEEENDVQLVTIQTKGITEFLNDGEDREEGVQQTKPSENNLILETLPSQPKQENPRLVRYYAHNENLFVKSRVPLGTAVKLSFQYQKVKNKQIYSLLLGEHTILTCIAEGKVFVFETSEGVVGYARLIAGTYELSVITEEEHLASQYAAKVSIERKTLMTRKFSTITVEEFCEQPKNGIRTKQIRTFRSRDPFINSEGKLQLKVSNTEHVRPSAFNCLLEDEEGGEVCSLMHTHTYELIVGAPFSVLLGVICAVARIDWSSNRSQE